ncbi:MAG: hypothetical protein KME31_34150 [Tolypothrix carrinoi HA7290-LM1]|jgi:hypothetical protein|nr:hypothetical protein [Tolypothrix carrinoi HA7290-LM1]
MKIRGEYLEDALEKWHPEQSINVYDTLTTGEFVYNCEVGQVHSEDVDPYYFAEAVDEDGEPCKPKLKTNYGNPPTPYSLNYSHPA